MSTALVTGASSGIGAEIARRHAALGGDLVLTARSGDVLERMRADLARSHGITVHVVPLDLGAPGAAASLHNTVTQRGITVDVLVCNAGFGGRGAHLDRDLGEELGMIDLNLRSLVELCHLFGRDMVARGTGRILNVGSTAGFVPGPGQAVYFATKAFVNSYSQALAHELAPKGVTVTVLTPGYVETGFADRAGVRGTAMVKHGGNDAASVARVGYDAMKQGALVRFDRALLGIALRFGAPLVPRRLLLKLIAKSQGL